MNTNNFDLNLFLVFSAVYRTRSVTAASEELCMTQSAVSNALRRLRDRLGDELFVRTPSGMAPTALAEQVADSVEEGIRHLTLAFGRAERFDPASSDRLFRIAINDIGQLILMPTLFQALRAQAPGVRVETADAGDMPTARALLAEGKVDLAIGSWEDMGADFYRQELFEETFVALVSKHGAAFDDPMSLDQYLACEHLTYRPSGRSDAALQHHLDQLPELAQRRVALTMAHSLGLPSIVASSTLVLSAQARLAEALALSRDDLHWVRLPFEVPPFPVRQQWHARRHGDNGHRWLRQLTYGLFFGLPLPPRLRRSGPD